MVSAMVENKVVGEVDVVEVAFAVAATVTDQAGAGQAGVATLVLDRTQAFASPHAPQLQIAPPGEPSLQPH
jgi:hypothetical protein